MRILITNNTLASRAGTELYTRDIAMRLREMGHEPVCFSLTLGEVAEELRTSGINVTDNLALIEKPDVIHGHHAIETTLAGITFPQTPVISFCHGPKVWQESPCRLPNVVAYVAVDEACRRRLVDEEGIPANGIQLILNFADTRRFQPRPPLPDRPKRALVFSNMMRDGEKLDAVRAACDAHGIALDVAGIGSSRPSSAPEHLLQDYDLVFAKARAAIEAMATGCAVIQLDYFGSGHLITPALFDKLRPLNFGYLSMQIPITREHLENQISLYNPTDASLVSARIRNEASLDATMPQLLELYQRASHATFPHFEPAKAAGDFLRLVTYLSKHYIDLAGVQDDNPFLLLRQPLDMKTVFNTATQASTARGQLLHAAACMAEDKNRLQLALANADSVIAPLIEDRDRLNVLTGRLIEERKQMRQRWLDARGKLALAKERIQRLKQERRESPSWWQSLWKKIWSRPT